MRVSAAKLLASMIGKYSTKGFLMWVVGMLVAAAITIIISFFVVERFLAAHNQQDPLPSSQPIK